MKILALKSLQFDLQAQKSSKISKNGHRQQHTYCACSRETFLPLFGLSAFLCVKIGPSGDMCLRVTNVTPLTLSVLLLTCFCNGR